MDKTVPDWRLPTVVAQALGASDRITGAVIPPLHVATTYARNADHSYPSPLSYGRPDNPTVLQTEAVVAHIENAAQAMLFGSGMSAAVALMMSCAPGDRILVPHIMYWGLRNWFATEAKRKNLMIEQVDMTNLRSVELALRQRSTKVVWVETPANPTWEVSDIAAISQLAHDAGAIVAVDSTCATPVFTRPIDFGADYVMHSATKYLNGHSDVIAGVLCCKIADERWEQIGRLRSSQGMIIGPFESHQLLRGMRTLHLRVRRAAETALALAHKLEHHPAIEKVLYPGLTSHPHFEIACRQMEGGFGGMLSIRVKGGAAIAINVLSHLKLWRRATSLGGVESLIEHRATVEGPDSQCPEDLLRLSVGIEAFDDLYADLDQALMKSGHHR